MTTFKVTAYDGAGEPRTSKVKVDNKVVLIAHGREIPLDLARAKLELGSKHNDSLRLTDEATGVLVTTDDPRFLDALATSKPPEQLAALLKQYRAVMPNSPSRRRRIKMALAAGLVAALVAGNLGLNALTELAVAKITPEIEEQLGAACVDRKYDGTSDAARRVQRIGAKLVDTLPAKPYHFHFYLDDDPEINAFCLPGGNIVVEKGMVEKAKNDDELAGVIGHEIGHAIHRDVVRRTAHDLGFDLTVGLVFGGKLGQLKSLINNAETLEHARFSRAEEAAADTAGVELAFRAGYKPEAVATLFERLIKDIGDAGALAFMSDHPATSKRIVDIREQARKLRAESGVDEQASRLSATEQSRLPSHSTAPRSHRSAHQSPPRHSAAQ
jgi:predicted Zn-dependent protease